MRYVSTRAGGDPARFEATLSAGLAPDGGLWVPERLPRVTLERLPADVRLDAVAAAVLAPFLADGPLADGLDALCAETFEVDAPLRDGPTPRDPRLELFHGPTGAFKDYGARFLAAALQRVDPAPRTVLVATSGDTGAAVAAAFRGRPGMRVVVLYPRGLVSARQAHQLGAFGGGVKALAVEGNFDDCQRLVKGALADRTLRERHRLTAANSISLGRLLPQLAYYARAALGWQSAHGEPLGFVVPVGNLGNAVACTWARALGAPIGTIALATNANRVLPEYLSSGEYRPAPAVATVANAMDVGAPSNLERLAWTYRDQPGWRAGFPSGAFTDDEIRAELARAWREEGAVLCPHTATASCLRRRLRAAGEAGALAVVATAHPSKFADIVEPQVGGTVPVPPPLQALLDRPSHVERLEADADALAARLDADG